ncbi:hypothetical protein Cgig2_007469 [Carnegiea gigantea]|uniref:Uncharacterized protein n=1 Tax=Carnegiea gigantea TaxID=171969 RepID=A0A9Q1K6Z5_9CARY|nr:hypothetical protein Cgig2_007469 [Carnegiea gigantea]
MSGRNSHSTEDIGWRFGIAIEESRKQVQRKFCSKVMRGEYKEKKRQKTRIARDLEDEITRSFNRNDYVDDEEEDAQLAHARYESLEQHRFEHEQRVYRASKGAHFDEGGSSRPPSVPQMRRSTTIRESSSRASRDMAYEQMSTPAARLRAVEVELEKDRTRTKQSKVNTSWLKAAKNKMIKAFGRYFFNPQYMFRQSQDWEDREVRTGVQNVIMRLEPDADKQIKAMRQVFLYKDRMDTFGASIGQRAIASLIVDQQPQDMQGSDRDSEENLPPSSSHGGSGSGGGGDGGNGGANEMGASYSSRRSTDYFSDRDRDRGRGVPLEDDRRSRRSPNEQPNEPTQTYRCIRKGFQEAPSSFTGPGLFASSGGHDTYGGFSNNYGYNTNCPPLPYPSNEPQFVGSDSSRRHSDNPPIINQETINYGDHHYYQPTFYSGDSNSSEQSWIDSTASSHYHQQQESYGVDQNNNETYQDPPRHLFRW